MEMWMDFYWYKYDKKIHTAQYECDLVTLNDNNKKTTILKVGNKISAI